MTSSAQKQLSLTRRLSRLPLRLLSSRAAAVAVMLAMAGILGLATLVPEAVLSDPVKLAQLAASRPITHWIVLNLRPSEIGASPYFLLLPGFLFGAISLSIFRRLKLFLRQRRERGCKPQRERFVVERELRFVVPVDEATEHLRATLGGRYALREPEHGLLVGTRGRLGFIGSICFHVGLLLVLAGIGVSGLTRMGGEILLAEGFPRPLLASSFLTLDKPDRLPPQDGRSVSIRDFMATYSSKGTPVDFSLLLSVHRDKTRVVEEQVRVNQAFHYESMQITLHRYGFAPTLLARDKSGARRLDGTGLLQLVPPGKQDSLALSGGGKLEIKLYPDYATLRGKVVSRSMAPNNPVVAFVWRDAAGQEVARGRVGLGQQVVRNGYRVAFRALSYWGGFLVAIDKGLWFVILGSLIGSLGLGLRFVFPDQALVVRCAADGEGTRVTLTASTRFFPALHEQFVERLEQELRDKGKRAT